MEKVVGLVNAITKSDERALRNDRGRDERENSREEKAPTGPIRAYEESFSSAVLYLTVTHRAQILSLTNLSHSHMRHKKLTLPSDPAIQFRFTVFVPSIRY